MELADIIIAVLLILFAIVGFNRGVFKSLVTFLGFIIAIFAAYAFKNYLGDILVLNLPFISLSSFGEISTLNIIMYQAIAFVIMLMIFGLIYKFLIVITGILEKLLNATIILGIPSKILGMIFGFLEGYVIIYLVLFFLTQPFLDFKLLDNSKYVPKILNETPIVSSYATNSLRVFNEVRDLLNIEDKEKADQELARVILKEKVISAEVMQELVDSNKISIDGIQEIINTYTVSN